MVRRTPFTDHPLAPVPLETASGAPPRDFETKSLSPVMPPPTLPPMAHMALAGAGAAGLADLTDRIKKARQGGLFIDSVALADIDPDYIKRDRINRGQESFAELLTSLRQRGQQIPLEVVAVHHAHYKYGLISGWRRYCALSVLAEEHKQSIGDTRVLVVIRTKQGPTDCYTSMIEENDIRLGISYFERARVLVHCVDQEQLFTDYEQAIRTLWYSSSKAKKSRIRSFIPIVKQLGPDLRFADCLGEALGRRLGQALLKNPSLADSVKHTLKTHAPETAFQEQALLKGLLNQYAHCTKVLPQRAKHALITPVTIYTSHQKNEIVLSGAACTPKFVKDLQTWVTNYFKNKS